MLAQDFDWAEAKAEVTYAPIDWVAIVRTGSNSYDYLPIFQKESNGACFVRWRDKMELAEDIDGFMRYEERPWRKRLLDSATQEIIEIPLSTN
jgi:hypothetical protein